MKPRTCKALLVDWLAANPGWHNKAKLTAMRWPYDGRQFESFAADTVAPKLREAEREGLIQKDERGGQTWYAALDVPRPKRPEVRIVEREGRRRALLEKERSGNTPTN